MRIVADLHIHSRFSRATSRDLDFAALYRGALEKGIGLLGTGDFTHPGWLETIEEQLVPAEEGLFRLRPELAEKAAQDLPPACRGDVRFVLQVEISNIYKKGDRTRKNHNLVYQPSLEAVRRFNEKLAAVGNLASDGRPILGLDARDLLEITLESDPAAFLIPAHIWTPWFSMLGSKSGFDSPRECFGDLSDHIFAAETGLSSDPAMNWRLSALDGVTLVSNSDAHSAAKLGREANLLDIEPSFVDLRRALETREGFLGTVEFYPEEGKYHLDGHRKCGLRLRPEQTLSYGGRCPVCGGKITVGVMSRVEELADRPEGARPEGAVDFRSLVPLSEAVAEVLGVGPQTKSTEAVVRRLLCALGPELQILWDVPVEDIEKVAGAPVGEAVRRIREGKLTIDAGYDGEFGTVRIFEPHERDALRGQFTLGGWAAPCRAPSAKTPHPSPRRGREKKASAVEAPSRVSASFDAGDPLSGLDAFQLAAATYFDGPLLVVAGPGTGKTRTLVARLAHMIRRGAVRPQEALAITFTNQAAGELSERLARAVPGDARPQATTFHGFGLGLLRELRDDPVEVVDDDERLALCVEASVAGGMTPASLLERISLAKQTPSPREAFENEPDLLAAFDRYDALLKRQGRLDVDDLVLAPYLRLAEEPELAEEVRGRFRAVCVDEYQDVNGVQAALISLLCPGGAGLCVIGDPDQAIYGFRGAEPGHFARFCGEYPDAREVTLENTYRLTKPVLAVAQSVLEHPGATRAGRKGPRVELWDCPTPAAEAEQIVVRLEGIVGGTSFFAVDSGRGGEAEEDGVGFGDVAVLTRTRAQHREILAALSRSGIPALTIGEDEPHDPRSQKVAVMTMHASKGREFEVVFIAGVEEGLVPLQAAGLRGDEAEERRLLYVAVTRAKRRCILSFARTRTLFGSALPAGRSRLLANAPKTDIVLAGSRPALRARRPEQLCLL